MKKHPPATQSSSEVPPSPKSTLCCRNFAGCNRSVSGFSDPEAAICLTCKLHITSQIEANPPPTGTCLCCHETPTCFQSSFCSNCSMWLQESGEVDSGLGAWIRNKITGAIICTDYGPPVKLD